MHSVTLYVSEWSEDSRDNINETTGDIPSPFVLVATERAREQSGKVAWNQTRSSSYVCLLRHRRYAYKLYEIRPNLEFEDLEVTHKLNHLLFSLQVESTAN